MAAPKMIFKYALPVRTTVLQLPIGAEILTVQTQRFQSETADYLEPVIWAIVDPSADVEERHFSTFGTGHLLPEENGDYNYGYIGTYQLYNGGFVGHVFEKLS